MSADRRGAKPGARAVRATALNTEPQSRADLSTHLQEQIGFLTTSAQLFDEGEAAEAKRLATTLRVLLHDSSASHSLLGQLGVKDMLRYADTSLEPESETPVRLLDGRYQVTRRKDAGLAQIRMSAHGVRYWPALDARPIRRLMPFDPWWTEPVLRDNRGGTFARRDLVLGLAHKDGGAHVDPALPAAWAALSRSNSLGWEVHVGGRLLSLESPVLANVRQVAHELVVTLHRQLPQSLRRPFSGERDLSP